MAPGLSSYQYLGSDLSSKPEDAVDPRPRSLVGGQDDLFNRYNLGPVLNAPPASYSPPQPANQSIRALTPYEMSVIRQSATKGGVDPGLLKSMAITENGPTVLSREGRQTRGLGVLSQSAPTFEDQVDIAGNTVANTLLRYQRAFGRSPVDPQTKMYTQDFLRYLSRGGPGYPGYAPIGTANDPRNLNRNHLPNLIQNYQPDTGLAPQGLSRYMPAILGQPQ